MTETISFDLSHHGIFGVQTSTGDKFPTSAQEVDINPPPVSNHPWTDESSIFSEDSVSASGGGFSGAETTALYGRGYNFGVPSGATIVGVEAKIKRKKSNGDIGWNDSTVQIVNPTVTGDDKSLGSGIGTSYVESSFGGESDLWGLSLTPSDVNSSSFGLAYQATKGFGGSARVEVDSYKMNIYYKIPRIGPVEFDLYVERQKGFDLKQ